MLSKSFFLFWAPQVPRGCRQTEMAYLANQHYILCPKFNHRHAPIYIVLFILSVEPTLPSITLACLILFPWLVLSSLRVLSYFELRCYEDDVLLRLCPPFNECLVRLGRALTACVAAVVSHTYFLCPQYNDTSYAFEHPFATRLTITMVVLLHISGPLTILLRPHIFDIIAWKLQTAILPRLQLDIENFCRDVRDFTSLLHGVTAAHGELQIIKSALQKHGKVTLHLGQGQITEVVKVETPFEPSFARKRLRMLILESNVRFEGEDSIRREASIWEYLAQFPEPHPHFATLRATHSDESPPFFDYRPVGEMDLGAWLQHHYNISSQDDIFKPTLLGWFGCVQSVMVHLHEVNHVLHCDIKPNNFIISSNLLYLIDHSLSRVLTKESGYTSSERIEVSKYTAPEVIKHPEPKSFSTDVFGIGLIFLHMLATLCGLDPSELTNAFHKAENNFWHSTKLNWIVHKYMPRLQRHKIQSLCSPAEFEALKAIIVEMIQEDPRKRPSLSTIALPRPFQGDCCSRPEPPLHQGTANSEPNVSDPEKHGLQARQDLQGPRLSVPNIIVDQDPDPVEEGQHTRTLTPSSQRSESSFLFSQNTTEVSMSSAASILGKEDVWPAAANHELADQPKDQQYEVLAYSSGPWASRTPERGVDPTDLELASSRRSKSMQERVVGARKTIVIAERAFLGSPLKKEAAFSRQRRESALLSRRSHKHRTIPSRTASPLVSAGTADPARVTKDQVAMALRTFYQDLPAGAAAGDGTFLEGASRRESEVSKRKSIQELVLRFPEAQSDIYDALGSGPIRHPTWPPEQPQRNIPSP